MLPYRLGISRTSHGLRCFALTVASSAPASESELRLETGSLNAIAATKKAAPKKKKLDSVSTLLTATTTEAGPQKTKLDSVSTLLTATTAEAGPQKTKLDSVSTLLTTTKTKAAPKKKKLDLAAEDAQINQFPVYSYDHCKPLPTVVYIQHEEEANELIAGLKAGYVLSIIISRFPVCL